MTGLSVYDNYIYLSSRNQNRAYRYTLPGITTRTNFTYYVGANMTCDIAFNGADNLVWVASESTTVPVRCYDNANVMVDYISPDLIPNARGLTLDPEGYLWISDIDNDKIYKVDISASALTRSTWAGIKTTF